MLTWLMVFGGTLVVEAPIYSLGLRRVLTPLQVLLAVLVVNLATHPLVWFVLPVVIADPVAYAVTAEGFAIATEGLLLWVVCRRGHSAPRALLWYFGLAFVANAASAGLWQVLYFGLERLGLAPV